MEDEHRAANPRADVPEALEPAELEGVLAVDQRLGGHLEAPADAVLDLLRRMGLAEDPPEEVLEEVLVVLEPVVAVVLRPAFVGVEPIVERVDVPLGMPGASGTAGPMKTAPATRSGWSAASSVPQSAPQESPTTTADSVPVASITASESSANSCSV